MRNLTAEHAPKLAFVEQGERDEHPLEIEAKINVPLPFVASEIDSLRRICEAFQKTDIARVLKRDKDRNAPSSKDFDFPPGPAGLESAMKDMDEPDKNLVQEFAIRLIDLAQEGASGRIEIERLGAEQRPESGSEAVGDPKASEEDVARGA